MKRTHSILRRLEDASLGGMTYHGRVLDLGGHRNSSYYASIKTEQKTEIVNLDALTPGTHKTPSGADHIFDLEQPFPLSSASYDAVLCVNVLEHIYNYANVLREAYRVLRPGGRFYITVPFFFNIHGSPNDYFRYTRSALERMLKDAGFRDATVTELGYGPCTAVFQNFGGSIPTELLRLSFMHCAIGIDTLLTRVSRRYASIRTRVPLGYFVEAQK